MYVYQVSSKTAYMYRWREKMIENQRTLPIPPFPLPPLPPFPTPLGSELMLGEVLGNIDALGSELMLGAALGAAMQ